MIKYVIFDLGGVIIHWSDDIFYKKVAKICNRKFEDVKMAFEPLRLELAAGKINEDAMVKKAMKQLDSDYNLNEIKNLWWKMFRQKAKTNYQMIKIMSKLRRNGYRLALLSNTGGYSHIRVYKKSWFKHMDKIIFSTPIGMAKPGKQIYIYALRKLKAKPHECIFIDNEKKNVAAARRLGINAILFRDAMQLKKNLTKLGMSI